MENTTPVLARWVKHHDGSFSLVQANGTYEGGLLAKMTPDGICEWRVTGPGFEFKMGEKRKRVQSRILEITGAQIALPKRDV
jgi:hypothetical protein